VVAPILAPVEDAMRRTGRDGSRTLCERVALLVIAGCGFAGGAGAEEPAAAGANASAASARLREALEAEAAGEAARARAAFEAVVAIDPEHAAARRALGFERVDGRWLTGDELKRARGLVEVGGRWLSREEAEALPRAAGSSAAGSRTAGSRAAGSRTAGSRAASPTVEKLDVAAHVRLALEAPAADRREAAVAALRTDARDAARRAFESALARGTTTTRVRAAEALGLLRDTRAACALVDAWFPRQVGTRGHFAQTRQIGYLQDYEVEVA
jgi:hypothetical protein